MDGLPRTGRVKLRYALWVMGVLSVVVFLLMTGPRIQRMVWEAKDYTYFDSHGAPAQSDNTDPRRYPVSDELRENALDVIQSEAPDGSYTVQFELHRSRLFLIRSSSGFFYTSGKQPLSWDGSLYASVQELGQGWYSYYVRGGRLHG